MLAEHDLKRFAHLRRDPKRLDEMLQKLQSRKERGIVAQAELDAITKLEAFRKHVERVRAGRPTKQDRKDMKGLRGRRTTGDKQDLEGVFEDLGRGRLQAAKIRSVRPSSTVGVRRVVSGGAPGLGRRG
ncbi:hypothetical protein TVH25_11805 [Rhodococcus sp. 7Tela_A2]|uniref:hypothetical protein n=1 Tax=Rhodococcus sp. 7Tela_A2 TaxID=3093744 RepID=UPI003BB6ABEF